MRFLLALVGIAALVVVALVSLGLLKLDTKGGALPSVRVDGGKAPSVDAEMGKVEFGTKNKAIEVPTVTTTTKTVAVPTLKVTKPGEADASTANAH